MKINKQLLTSMASAVALAGAGFYVTDQVSNTNGFTQIAKASTINNYIAQKGFKHSNMVYKSYPNLPNFNYRHGKAKPEGVVVHETANPNSTIWNEITFMVNNYNSAFVHAYTDANNIIQVHNTDYGAWGAGPLANERYIHIELVREHNLDNFAKSVNNQAYFVAYELKHYGLTPSRANKNGGGTVWSHADVSRYLGGTDHTDPETPYFSNWGYSMSEFYELVVKHYNELSANSKPAPKPAPKPDPNLPDPVATSGVKYVKNTSGTKIYDSPYSNHKYLNRSIGYKTAWKVSQKVTLSDGTWYSVGTNQWVNGNDLSDTKPEDDTNNNNDNDNGAVQKVNGTFKVTSWGRAQVYSFNETKKAMVPVAGKKFEYGSLWYTDRIKVANGKSYYRVSTNEWLEMSTGQLITK